MNIDSWRKIHLAIAEWADAWRVAPRMIVVGYSYVMWSIIRWYMELTPTMIQGCDVELLKEACIEHAPSTQHAALVTAIVGIAAAVFGLYASSGKKWNGFTPWNKSTQQSNNSED